MIEILGSWADARYPRIDLIAESQTGFLYVNGTSTPGADLTNVLGAPQIPPGHRLHSYVLVSPMSGRSTYAVG